MIRSIGVKILNKRTINRINKMTDAVLTEPDLYNQNTFGEPLCKTNGDEICGTACCAAGKAVFLFNRPLFNEMMAKELRIRKRNGWGSGGDSVPWVKEAMKALGLETDNEDDTDKLFGSHTSWPTKWREKYENATTQKQKARAFAGRWRDFIKADGQEADELFYY